MRFPAARGISGALLYSIVLHLGFAWLILQTWPKTKVGLDQRHFSVNFISAKASAPEDAPATRERQVPPVPVVMPEKQTLRPVEEKGTQTFPSAVSKSAPVIPLDGQQSLAPPTKTVPKASNLTNTAPALPQSKATLMTPQGQSHRDYQQRLVQHLRGFQTYPRLARQRGFEDTVVVAFEIDRSGTLLNYQLQRVSKYAVLNRAVERMMRQAFPVPPVPQSLLHGRHRLTYTVPVRFELSADAS